MRGGWLHSRRAVQCDQAASLSPVNEAAAIVRSESHSLGRFAQAPTSGLSKPH